MRNFSLFLFLIAGSFQVFCQKTNPGEEIISKTISIDSLKKVQYLEDLLDSFPKEDYYVYYFYVTKSGKGYITTTTAWDNDINRYSPKVNSLSQFRQPIIKDLFLNRDHPPKANQKLVFDRIHIRKFKDKHNSEPYPSLELYNTD